jgi:chromosome segregation ATPase
MARAKPKPTAHDRLAELRDQTVAVRMKVRAIEDELQGALADVQHAETAIVESHADENGEALAIARQAHDEAVERVRDFEQRLDGAKLRVARAQQAMDTFIGEHARDLLQEREPRAREVAAALTRAGADLLRAHREYVELRVEIDRLVAAVPGASPRTDGPPATYPWEREVRDLERVIRESPEVEPPLPSWRGVSHRREEERAVRLLRERRAS